MNLRNNIHSALDVIRLNKVRSFLTMLGIIIGVTAVVVIMSVGAGAQSLIVNQIKSMGTNLIGVLPGKSDDKGPPASVFGIVITSLKDSDRKALLNGDYPHIVSGSSYVRGTDTVNVGSNKVDTFFLGVNSDYPSVEDVKISSGRFFTEDENASAARYAVLGSSVAKDLFFDEDPIGRLIKIKKTNFLVIGVAKERGTSGFSDQDNQIFVPLETAQKELLGIDYVNFMRFKVDNSSNINGAMEDVRTILRERHEITNPENDDFSVRSSNQELEAMTQVTNALKFFLAAIAALSLLVGGIGIMNIMLAAVEERTKEIGLRKAVGANSGNIVSQFLTETVMITFVGGIIGIILGSGISSLVALVARKLGYNWDLVISPFSIILGCAVSIGIGLVFGIVPARRASKLSPISALHYE